MSRITNTGPKFSEHQIFDSITVAVQNLGQEASTPGELGPLYPQFGVLLTLETTTPPPSVLLIIYFLFGFHSGADTGHPA